jgi:hypothetical protein
MEDYLSFLVVLFFGISLIIFIFWNMFQAFINLPKCLHVQLYMIQLRQALLHTLNILNGLRFYVVVVAGSALITFRGV